VTGWRLVGDVGGSNARFARASGSTLHARRCYSVRNYPSFYDALGHYLEETGGAEGCHSAAFGVAGPVDAGRVKLTNAPWTIDAKEATRLVGGAPAGVVNDLQAVALALPYLGEQDLAPLGTAVRSDAKRTMLALNVGTGFGAASVVPAGEGWVSSGSEPGHMALGALDADQLRVVEPGTTVEDLMSGRGVRTLYRRLAARKGVAANESWTSADIFQNASADPIASETVHCFSKLLGRVAGDLVLASGAWGGVYLCGSVVDGWAEVADIAEFREPFERKGLMSERMRGVYSGIIKPDEVPLIGLTHLNVGPGTAA
jgi:glucokinase